MVFYILASVDFALQTIVKFIYKYTLLYTMVEIRVNIAFRNLKKHKDSERRSDHIFERMQLRGITTENIKEAIQKGAKRIRDDQSIIAEFRWFKVIYREFHVNDIRKIYPITVLD